MFGPYDYDDIANALPCIRPVDAQGQKRSIMLERSPEHAHSEPDMPHTHVGPQCITMLVRASTSAHGRLKVAFALELDLPPHPVTGQEPVIGLGDEFRLEMN
jgi:hypothetical protein